MDLPHAVVCRGVPRCPLLGYPVVDQLDAQRRIDALENRCEQLLTACGILQAQVFQLQHTMEHAGMAPPAVAPVSVGWTRVADVPPWE